LANKFTFGLGLVNFGLYDSMFDIILDSSFSKVEYGIKVIGLLEEGIGSHKLFLGEVEEDSNDGLILENGDHFFIESYICIF
jgi:hypothetical protein